LSSYSDAALNAIANTGFCLDGEQWLRTLGGFAARDATGDLAIGESPSSFLRSGAARGVRAVIEAELARRAEDGPVPPGVRDAVTGALRWLDAWWLVTGDDGRVRCTWKTQGDGRLVATKIAIQSIPKTLRTAVVEPGGWILYLDVKSSHPRLLAALSGDDTMRVDVARGALYALASEAVGRPQSEAKRWLLARINGLGQREAAKRLGSDEAANAGRAWFDSRYPAAAAQLGAWRGGDGAATVDVDGAEVQVVVPPGRPTWNLPYYVLAQVEARRLGALTANLLSDLPDVSVLFPMHDGLVCSYTGDEPVSAVAEALRLAGGAVFGDGAVAVTWGPSWGACGQDPEAPRAVGVPPAAFRVDAWMQAARSRAADDPAWSRVADQLMLARAVGRGQVPVRNGKPPRWVPEAGASLVLAVNGVRAFTAQSAAGAPAEAEGGGVARASARPEPETTRVTDAILSEFRPKVRRIKLGAASNAQVVWARPDGAFWEEFPESTLADEIKNFSYGAFKSTVRAPALEQSCKLALALMRTDIVSCELLTATEDSVRTPHFVGSDGTVVELTEDGPVGRPLVPEDNLLRRFAIAAPYVAAAPDALAKLATYFVSIWDDPAERQANVAYLQEVVCDALFWRSHINARITMLVGRGGGGKSTLLMALGSLFSAGMKTNLTPTEFGQNFGLAPLASSRINLGTEAAENAWAGVAIAKMKQVSSGDPMVADVKQQAAINFFGRTALLFSVNELPRLLDDGGGLERRMRYVNWPSRPADERSPLWGEWFKSAEGKAALLGWALLAWSRCLANTYTMPHEDAGTKEEVRTFSCSITHFLAEECAVGNTWVRANTLYPSFRVFCEANGHALMSSATFAKRLPNRVTLAPDWEKACAKAKKRKVDPGPVPMQTRKDATNTRLYNIANIGGTNGF